MKTKFKAGDIAKSEDDGSVVEIIDVYQGRFSVEYKISWTERGSTKTRYVMASDIDNEFGIDALGMRFVHASV